MMKEVVLKSVKFMFWNISYIFLLKQASNYFLEKMQETKLRPEMIKMSWKLRFRPRIFLPVQ